MNTERIDEKNNRFWNGAFWNMMGSGLMAANTVLLTMLVGHYSTLPEIGIFTLSLTSSQVMYAVGLWGLNDLQMTDYSHRYSFSNYFWAKIVSTVTAILFCIAAVNILGLGEKACIYTVLLTSFMMINSFADLYQSLYFQNQRLDLSGKALFFRYLSSTIAFMVVIIRTRIIAYACISMLCADFIVTIYWIKRYAGLFRDSGYGLQVSATLDLLQEGLPLAGSLLASLFLMNAQNYMIYLLVSDEAQGVYTLLFMPVYAVNLMSQFLFKPYLHQYSRMLQDGQEGFMSLFTKQMVLIGSIAVSGAVCIRILGVKLYEIFFGQNLQVFRDIMPLFLLSGGILAVNQLLYYLMVILRKRRAVLFNYLISAVLAVPFGIIFIPKMVIVGAWISFTISQVSLMAGYFLILIRCLGKMDVKTRPI